MSKPARYVSVAAVALLLGCATLERYNLPLEQRYARLSWAKVSVHEAEARCHAEIQKNITLGMPTCMRALGWQEN